MPSISDADTPDPWMLKYKSKYLLTFTSGGDHIELWSSPLLEDFHIATRRDIWYNSHSGSNNRRPADSGSKLVDIWAPEIHIIDDCWWIYFAAAIPDLNGEKQNASRRMYVLCGPPASVDPMEPSSTFTFGGPVLGLPDKWAIDGTMFYINQDLYFAYSGWPQDATDGLKQELYITKMKDPRNAISAIPISSPQFEWELFQDPKNGHLYQINEGPAWLDIGTFKGIVFSAGASWDKDYQLGVLQYVGGNPLDKTSWNKFSTQLLRNNTSGEGPYGPGHCSFVPSPDGRQTWVVYHATPGPNDRWSNRKGRCQPVNLKSELPDVGYFPLSDGALFPVPSGTVIPANRSGYAVNDSTVPAEAASQSESVAAQLPSGQNADQAQQKAKVVWQNLKRRISKLRPAGRK